MAVPSPCAWCSSALDPEASDVLCPRCRRLRTKGHTYAEVAAAVDRMEIALEADAKADRIDGLVTFRDVRLIRGRMRPCIVVRETVDFVFEVGSTEDERHRPAPYLGLEQAETEGGALVVDPNRNVLGVNGEDPFEPYRRLAERVALEESPTAVPAGADEAYELARDARAGG